MHEQKKYPAVSKFMSGKFKDNSPEARTFPRWLRRSSTKDDLPSAQYVHAFAFKHIPQWLCIWADSGEWDLVPDDIFIHTYKPSNNESRQALEKIIERRPKIARYIKIVLGEASL